MLFFASAQAISILPLMTKTFNKTLQRAIFAEKRNRPDYFPKTEIARRFSVFDRGDFVGVLIKTTYFPHYSEVESGGIFLRSTSHLLEIGLDVEVQRGACICMA